MTERPPEHTFCSFCGQDHHDGKGLVAGGGKQPARELPRVAICDDCVALCNRIIADRAKRG